MNLPQPLGPLRLTSSLRHYEWGDRRFIPELLALNVDGAPCAEAWFGAHPVAPAQVEIDCTPRALHEVIAAHPEAFLGREARARFGGMPYLLKLLAADKPLSIQVHPNLEQAREGFEREERAGIPRDAPQRCYRDLNHKPELFVALTRFDALCGFRAPEAIEAVLTELPEIRALLPSFEATIDGLRTLLQAYFSLPDERLIPALEQLIARLEVEDVRAPFPETHPAYWVLRAHRMLSAPAPDRGLLFVFLLELIRLEPGQALFLPAGVPHSYLRGAGLELMASSDNVLRAGLTSKHVDPEELLRVVRFDAGRPPILQGALPVTGSERIYDVPAAEFDLRRLDLDSGTEVSRIAEGPETLLVLGDEHDTRVAVQSDGRALELGPGQACLLPSGARYRLKSSGAASVYRVKLPSRTVTASFRGCQPTELRFGTSGLRGLVSDITDLEVYVNTRGFLDFLLASGDAVPGTPVALAGDLRPSTKRILRAVARAVTDSGMHVHYCGRIPTPALTYFGLQKGWPSIMVTGSHIPFDRNGIKFNKSTGEVLKSDEGAILEAVGRVRQLEYDRPPEHSLFDDEGGFSAGRAPTLPVASEQARALYVQRYLDAFSREALLGHRVALYEHSSVGREILAEVLRGLGAEVYPVGRSEEFVAIDTEAVEPAQLAALQELADTTAAEVGELDALVSTDGDSDRPMLLGLDRERCVRFFGGDVLGVVVAEYLAADSVAVPISANDLVKRHLASQGVDVVRTKIGSPWVIAAMAAQTGQRRVGFEANGGFMTGSVLELEGGPLAPLPTRDAVLPLVAALCAAKRKGRTLVEHFSDLPKRFSKSGLLDDVQPAASRRLLKRFGPHDPHIRRVWFEGAALHGVRHDGRQLDVGACSEHFRDLRADLEQVFCAEQGFGRLEAIDYLDGIRLVFEGDEVAHVRPSGNAPQLRIYATANAEARAEQIVALGLAEPEGLLRRLLCAADA